MAVSPVQIVGLLTVIESPEPIVIDAVVELVHVPFAPVMVTTVLLAGLNVNVFPITFPGFQV